MTIIFDVIAVLALGLSAFNFIKARPASVEVVAPVSDIADIPVSTQSPTPEVPATGHKRTVNRPHFARGR